MTVKLTNTPFFSILIPTRNRPSIMADALNSVINQDHQSFEVIVINDGSDESYLPEYNSILTTYKDKVTLLNLEQSINGHGPSYALNMGVNIAKGKYIAFLDDDDIWTTKKHLHDAQKELEAQHADLYLSLQKPYKNNIALDEEIWLTPLKSKINSRSKTDKISIEQLFKSNGFAHRNNLIISKALYQEIEGHDENLRYEEDREFYFRAIEQAKKILFNPTFISRHNIPNNKITNLSATVSAINKQRSRLYLLDKLLLNSNNKKIQAYIESHKLYTLKALTEILYKSQKFALASHYAKQALALKTSLKWLVFTLYLTMKKYVL